MDGLELREHENGSLLLANTLQERVLFLFLHNSFVLHHVNDPQLQGLLPLKVVFARREKLSDF